MAIRQTKYVDVTSGIANGNEAARRSLGGCVFTDNYKLAYNGVKKFSTADDVMAFFGADSEEYDFAVKYFSFISKSITRAKVLTFVPWNWKYLDKEWYTCDIEVGDNGATVDFGGGKRVSYPDIVKCLAQIPDYAVCSVKLNTDVVYVTSNTFANKARGFDETNCKVSDDEQMRMGIVITDKQYVVFDLNGRKLSFDIHCFTNNGFLKIVDKYNTGCVFTTNFDEKTVIDGKEKSHVDATWEGASSYAADTIYNNGYLIIEGGYYGTDKPNTHARVNDVNWGLCLVANGGVAHINGGYFTTVANQEKAGNGFATKLQTYLDTHYPSNERGVSWLANATFPNAGKGSWGFIAETHYHGRIVVNGGTFFGFPNGGIGCVADRGESEEKAYGAVEINDCNMIIGYPTAKVTVNNSSTEIREFTYEDKPPHGCFAYAGTNGDKPSSQRNMLPSGVPEYSFSRVIVRGGRFENRTTGFANFPFSGRTSVQGGEFVNVDVGSDFRDFFIEIDPADRVERPEVALSRVNEQHDDFGSFMFMQRLSDGEIKSVALQNKTMNFKYLYSVAEGELRIGGIVDSLAKVGGVCLTLDKFGDRLELLPMVYFASTDYTRVNTTKAFMFQKFDSAKPSVTETEESDEYDSQFVNYIGQTQQAGKLVTFYQQGVNADGLETSVYCNEVWLKDSISTSLLNLFIALEKIPSNRVGATIIETQIMSVIQEALRNGVITSEKPMTTAMKVYADTLADKEGAWKDVYADGYYLSVKYDSTSEGRVVNYILIYLTGESIRRIEGSDILV